ncbi:helix-turn-helix transcriptional regulator [Paractinoplanes maris]|uniref:helix-turn-helix transcriptional regulator n=1 Tax=Paractinoplanes maris TaxID=1734446 RepID=UPI002021868E|nr:LuxR family transcriptional regulator [Actinoplanes maris]
MATTTNGVTLRGRRKEQHVLDRLLLEVRAGRSRALVLRGEAGSGKTALLDYLAGRGSRVRVLRTSGVESESEIAYSGVQQLCAPLLNHLNRLPEPQRAALNIVFGLSGGPTPDLLVLGMATLGLLAEAALEEPLVCLVDDVQWLDRLSGLILAFVARRLDAESVALVFAVREQDGGDVLAGVPELAVPGLPESDAQELLDSVLAGPVDARVRDRIVAETRGNPLALLELTRGLSSAELAFGFGGLSTAPLAGRVEEGFRRRIAALPPDTRTVLLAAAVEPIGDTVLLWRALRLLGVEPEAATPAEADGLIEFGIWVRFRHPLVRSAAWRSSTAADLRRVHQALAEVTDPVRDPDRRAWHQAHAAAGPDDEVAKELVRLAGRALTRGGRSAAAAFLERAAALTGEPARRGALLVDAAAARATAGSYAQVPDLLAVAELTPLSDFERARAERLRAHVTFVLTPGRTAGPALLAAANRLRRFDRDAARDAYLTAIGAAVYAGRFGGQDLRRAAEEARDVPCGRSFPDLLLAGLVSWVLDGRAAAMPALRSALDAMGAPEDVSLIWLASPVAHEVHRMDLVNRMSEQAVCFARETGALSLLPAALMLRAGSLLFAGRFAGATNLLAEADAVTQATGGSVQQSAKLQLAAYRGHQEPALQLIDSKLRDATERGDGRLHSLASYAKAVLGNGLGDHQAALDAARDGAAYEDLALHGRLLSELVEAAVRAGDLPTAGEARERLAEQTTAAGAPSALGLQALADALAGPPQKAEERYREAVELLTTAETAIEGFRAQLLFGEWLRRGNRRTEARPHLRAAHEAFTSMGAEAFAERAGRELAATGETVRRHVEGAADLAALTAQEAAVARLAATGETNPGIAATLFLSPRTVEWHLRKVYLKLGITSRRELATTLRPR